MKTKLTALSMAMLVSTSSLADIQWNGFASIVAGQTTSSSENLYGYENEFEFDQDSIIALQASNDLGDGFGVTAQVLARGNNDYDPKFEWAYVSYDVDDSLRVIVGRQRAPFYMYSDFLDVSYAYPWITPPTGVYDVLFNSYDGLGAIYTTDVGEFDLTTQFMYGKYTGSDGANEGIEAEKMTGFAVTATRDWLTLRASYFTAKTTTPSGELQFFVDAWQNEGYNSIADKFEFIEEDTSFAELGFQIDHNDYLLIGEYTKLEIKDVFTGASESYFVTAGKRFDDFLLHVTYGADEANPSNITSEVAFGLSPSIDLIKGMTEFLGEAVKEESKYVTLGLRWEFNPSAALKFEYTSFTNELTKEADANLFRMAVVTVF
jgi:hypothetical protein